MADASGRYVTPFVDFSQQGNAQLQLIASLNASRLATWGFTAEAEVRGMARYRLTAVLDGRTSKFCRMISGKIFNVPAARAKVIEALNVQNPDDLKVVQPWPKQTKAAMAAYQQMSTSELTDLGLHIPPYHPHCRTLCRAIQTSAGTSTEVTPTIPAGVEMFQAVTAEDLQELGIDSSPEAVTQWNDHLGMSPVELFSKLTGMTPQTVMTSGVGSNPVQFGDDGIGLAAHGASADGVEFKLGAFLDPFTGTFYLTHADLLKGSPDKETAFLKRLFSALIETGIKSNVSDLAVGVGGNAAYFAKLGFLPETDAWEALRTSALSDLQVQEVLASLEPDDALLVTHLLQDDNPSALSALVDLPFTYEGKTIGEWILEKTEGVWSMDLLDNEVIDQAQAYLA